MNKNKENEINKEFKSKKESIQQQPDQSKDNKKVRTPEPPEMKNPTKEPTADKGK